MSVVERISAKGVSGWVDLSDTGSNEIIVKVNDQKVTTCFATRELSFDQGQGILGFSRYLTGLWRYVGQGDGLTFEYGGKRLPIVGHGYTYRPQTPREDDLKDLLTKIEKGWIFDKRGNLVRPLAQQRKASLFVRSYSEIRQLLLREAGVEIFPIYGTLLGCIREGNFIAHDNDIDVTYISKYTTPADIKAEYLKICSILIDAGYQGLVQAHGFGIKRPVMMDIYPSWIDNGFFNISFGYHGEPAAWTAEMAVMEDRVLGGMHVRVPRGSEAILSQIYGPTWRIPDPGFSHYGRSRKNSPEFLPTEQELTPVFWKHYYKFNEVSGGSTFAEFVKDKLDPNSLILDIGCGTGRDSIYFGEQGFSVIGADRAQEGLDQVARRGLPNVEVVLLDLSDRNGLFDFFNGDTVKEARKAGKPVVVYLRFLLHAISEEVQRILLEAISGSLPSFTLVAEFRTDKDQDLPKMNAKHYRRFPNSDELCATLRETYGLTIEYFHEGTGLSVYKGEDPFLCRIIARRVLPGLT